MTEFSVFSRAVHARYSELSTQELFVVDVTDIFASYLAAFPEGSNPIFRERTEHDCNCCKQFIRRLGQLVAIKDGVVQTMWDVDVPEPYGTVARAMADLVRQAPIRTVFRTKERQYGQEYNYDTATDRKWNHFHGRVADRHYSTTPDTLRGDREAIAQVLRRGLEEIQRSDIETVLDLIESNSLYRGEEHKAAVQGFRQLQADYTTAADRDLFIWSNLDNRNARFRNTVIGTLLTDLAEHGDIERAVKAFETKVAPQNYKRPTALITQRMVDDAAATLATLGLESAIERRFAVIEDVSVNDVLFVDNSARGKMKGGIAGLLSDAVDTKPVSVKDATPIAIADFLRDVVPHAKAMSVLVSNSHMGNFVSLTAPVHDDTGKLLKWNNDFAWSYDGEVADSMRQRVSAAGGRVDGPFRFTHSWNHAGLENQSLMDLHVFFPGSPAPTQGRQDAPHGRGIGRGSRVGWDMRKDATTGGVQDVDYTSAAPTGYVPIENISFPAINRMPDGVYNCYIHNWQHRGINRGGFKAEIELNGAIYQYDYATPLKNYEWVHVAAVTLKDGKFSIEHKIPSGSSPQNKWGVKTETLAPVETLMTSPNHWDGAGEVGNRHIFFMLRDCKNPDATRGIYNEYLRGDLEKHRKVFEVLGSKTKCQPSDKQLSGVGFTQGRGDEVVVVVDRRAYRVQF